jgi:hypothetical protein
MIRYVALPALAFLAACSFVMPAKKDSPSAADLAKYEGWVQDLRARDSLQRTLALPPAVKNTDPNTVAVEVGPNERRILVTDAAEAEAPAQLFKICNHATKVVPVNLDIYANPNAGSEHPATEHVALYSGQCTFARGRQIEAWRSDDGSQEQAANDELIKKTDAWLEARIAALETEVATKTDPRDRETSQILLNEFKSRTSGGYKTILPQAQVTVTPVPG